MDEDNNEEEDSWIPLSEASDNSRDAMPPSSSGTAGVKHESSARSAFFSTAPSGSSHPSTRRQSLQRRLETRVSLKSNFVDHPIDLFWKRYLWNLALEVWALEWYVRLGLCMVVSGIAIKLFLISTWYFWYPRFVLLIIVLLVGTIYLDPFDLKRQLDTVGKVLSNPENILLLQRLDSSGLRRLTLVLLLVPTALEMRTLSFLSGTKAETGWTLYNLLLSCTLLGSMMYWFRFKNIKPRECLYRGLLVLYGSALWVTIYKTNLSQMPVLAAPFLTATGTILITYQDDGMEWMSRVLRHALRLALRDVLSSMGNKVSEDEMLQLAILRWIADYWASAPTTESTSYTTSPASEQPRPPQPTRSESTASSAQAGPSMSTSSSEATSVSTRSSRGNAQPTQRRSAASILQRRHDVTWDELLPMLNIATDHMTSEVRMLQSDPQTRVPASVNTNSGTQTSPATSPIGSFHDMLRSLNVDERAEPAVRAYKRGVRSFPPSQEAALLISGLRRCPALLTIIWHALTLKPGFWSSTLVLLPFVVLEYHRIMAWTRCCEQVKVFFEIKQKDETFTEDNTKILIPEALRDADPMVILLVGDSYNPLRPPALLLVWQNVLNSVSALEMGLTAARCAETTAVAVQFAGNVMSLVQFGHEIHQRGILHGLMVLGKEMILMHSVDESVRHREATKYSHAAMNAMENAHRVARNVQTLAEDDMFEHVVQPIVGAAVAISGYGWLWGKEETSQKGATKNDTSVPSEGSTPDVSDETTSGAGKTATKAPEPQGRASSNEMDRLSDLMDEIVVTYADGSITEVSALCFQYFLSKSSDLTHLISPKRTVSVKVCPMFQVRIVQR